MLAQPAPPARSATPLAEMADRCVQCGLCLPHCPTYRLDATEAESPRGRIAYVKALATGLLPPSGIGDLHLDHCLGCRRCESVCPAGVEYGALLAEARAEQFPRRPLRWRERLALRLLAGPGLLARLLAIYRTAFPILPAALRPLPRPPIQPSIPAGDSPVGPALFTGCIARAYEPPAHAALIRLLAAVGIEANIPVGQTCCGTAAVHAGDTAQAEQLAAQNRIAFAHRQQVLSLSSGCQEILGNSLDGVAEVHDAVAFLEARGDSLRFRPARGRRIALHLPCTQRSVTRTGPALRRLLARVPDLVLIDLPDTGCCGAAGTHMLNEPARAAVLREPTIEAAQNLAATEILSANIGCRLHLANGIAIPVRHPLEFLAEQLA